MPRRQALPDSRSVQPGATGSRSSVGRGAGAVRRHGWPGWRPGSSWAGRPRSRRRTRWPGGGRRPRACPAAARHRPDGTCDHLQSRAFPSARRSGEDQELSVLYHHVQALHRHGGEAEAAGDAAQLDHRTLSSRRLALLRRWTTEAAASTR
jgi:hypothetical protein